MDQFAELPDWLITSFIGFVAAVTIYFWRQRQGIGEQTLAARTEEGRVIEMQERQIELLQEEVKTLRRRVDHLENVVADYQHQVRFYRERFEEEEDVAG